MKRILTFALSLLVMLALTVDVNAQEIAFSEEIVGLQGSQVLNNCVDTPNGDYYLRYVYLYTVQSLIAGRVNIVLERREGKFQRLRIEYLAGIEGWHLLNSHLYVGVTHPGSVDPVTFPYMQDTPKGLSRHIYYVDLANLGESFDRVFIAVQCELIRVGPKIKWLGQYFTEGRVETAWGFKKAWYPYVKFGQLFNPEGEPWGTFLPGGKRWPAYFMVNIPTNPQDPNFQCPQPFRLLVEFLN